VGLIATKICLQKNVPTFVGAINSEGVITGSGRLPQGRGDSLLSALESARAHLVRFGGHDAAAGFELKEDKFQDVLSAFQVHYETQEAVAAKALEFDVEAKVDEVSENLMRWLEVLGPFGQSFDVPVFCFRRLQIDEVIVMKGKHLKLKLMEPESRKKIEAVYFSAPPALLAQLPVRGERVAVIGELQWNYFSGRRSVQLLLKDFKTEKSDTV
jgi:single-stranded-DNA-specific exonuclease